jgi:hypothetical protein
VEDPGARPQPARSPVVRKPDWLGGIDVRSTHRLHVGGECSSDWKGKFKVRLGADGAVEGTGTAGVIPGSAGCDFAQAQVQTQRVAFSVAGSWEDAQRPVVHLRFSESTRSPEGSTDLGGFLATLSSIRPAVGAEPDRLHAQRSDGDQGTYVADYVVTGWCRSNCG